jgi:hypothetical protein
MKKEPLLTSFVSDLDLMLQAIDKKEHFTKSQNLEAMLCDNIARLRDHSDSVAPASVLLWKNF